MALDKIDNINVSLAGGALRARKLRAAVRAGKPGVLTARSWPSHCGAEATRVRGMVDRAVDNAPWQSLTMGNGSGIESEKRASNRRPLPLIGGRSAWL